MICLSDFEKYAKLHLPKSAWDFFASGADEEETVNDNKRALKRCTIYPRVLRDVSRRDSSVTILGTKLPFPVGISPFSAHKLAHTDGEEGTARAAAKAGTVMIVSSVATTSLEDIAAAAGPSAVLWFQLYVFKDRPLTEQLVRRAERAGYKALVLTVDVPKLGNRRADVRNRFTFPPHINYANLQSTDKVNMPAVDQGSGLAQFVNSQFDASLSWLDLQWFKSITSLPLILKGILTKEDAVLATSHGVSAICVSNHGGRQLDSAPASLDALVEIVKAVGNSCDVYMDGGIRTGVDVFKALALGAKVVFVGRPIAWGLAHSGEKGVSKILDILRTEFDNTLALTGCKQISDIAGVRVTVDHQSFDCCSQCLTSSKL